MADKETPADGVITGYGTIEGNLVYVCTARMLPYWAAP